MFDSVRGVQKFIRPNTTDTEGTATDMLSSFDSNGFTVGNASNTGSSADYAAWCFGEVTPATNPQEGCINTC